jgi:hypothetical protein
VTKAKTKPKKKSKPSVHKRAARKRASGSSRSSAKRAAKRVSKRASRPKPHARPARTAGPNSWLQFVEQHGVVLASARGPVPSVAEAVAGEPIIGSWWSHPKASLIFDTLSAIDDAVDIRCFKLLDGKVTFVHRRMWPALVRLARDGVLSPERVASVQQEHMPTGEHRNVVIPFPEWVPDEVARAADALTAEQARTELGSWA